VQAHAYAGAGTWTIIATPASRITRLRILDPLLSGFHSVQLRGNAITDFICDSIGNAVASVINSADMVGWTPTTWIFVSMPAGGTYTIDTADMVAWNLTASWLLYSMPAGTYTVNSADMVGWTPLNWILFSMPAGAYTISTADMVTWNPTIAWQLHSMPGGTYTFTAGIMANWIYVLNIDAYSLLDGGVPLTQADVDGILLDIYGSLATRTAVNGIVRVAGTNPAPSGIFQPAAACPVGALTPGKEIANELLNDGCATGGNVWLTVTFTP